MSDKYAVIGNPVEHSKSPEIHAAFAQQTDQDITYEAILAPLDGFTDTVNRLIAEGYQGVNVTVPFKFEAFDFATQLKLPAKLAGAVNTLSFMDGQIVGTNTDGVGLVRDIEQNLFKPMQSQRILILGAGGASEGVLHPILDTAPSRLVIANRNVQKAVAMVDKVSALKQYASIDFAASAYEDLIDQKFDVVINATSAGLSNAKLPIPNTIFADSCLAYDMMYGRETLFMTQARVSGARVADGWGMLVEQAAEAFSIWRGVRPETQSMIKEVRA